jgi:hypothetical protein
MAAPRIVERVRRIPDKFFLGAEAAPIDVCTEDPGIALCPAPASCATLCWCGDWLYPSTQLCDTPMYHIRVLWLLEVCVHWSCNQHPTLDVQVTVPQALALNLSCEADWPKSKCFCNTCKCLSCIGQYAMKPPRAFDPGE